MPGSYEAVVSFPFSVKRILGIVDFVPIQIVTFSGYAKIPTPNHQLPNGSFWELEVGFLGVDEMQEPWKTDKWFSSPWSYLPEVRQKQAFGSNLKIHDVTLRDGEQQTAVVFRREEKVAIAKKLDSLGIHRIEAGMPAVSPQDKAAISDIAALGLKAEIFGFARCIPAEIDVTKACGCSGVVIEIPASDHMIKYGYGWPVERAMKASIETTLAAKAAGLRPVGGHWSLP